MAQGQILASADVASHEAFGSAQTTLKTTGCPDCLSSEYAKCRRHTSPSLLFCVAIKSLHFTLVFLFCFFGPVNCLNKLVQKSEHCFCTVLAGFLLTLSPKFKPTSTVVGPRLTTPATKDMNNDAFALHSVLLALTATITMDCQQRLSPLSVLAGQHQPMTVVVHIFTGTTISYFCPCGRAIWCRGDN